MRYVYISILIISFFTFAFVFFDVRSTMQCLRTLQCDDRVVDIRYEIHGDIISLTLEHSGTYFYANDGSFAALGSCRIPKKQLVHCHVTAYTSILYRVYFEEEKRTRLQLNVLLATSDNRVFTYFVSVDKDTMRQSGKNVATNGALSMETKLFGAFPLPKHVSFYFPIPLVSN